MKQTMKQAKKKEQELTRVFDNPLINVGNVGISVNSNVVSEEILLEDEVSHSYYFAYMSTTSNFFIRYNLV